MQHKVRRWDVIKAQVETVRCDSLGQNIDPVTRDLARRSVRRPNGSLRVAFLAALATALRVEP